MKPFLISLIPFLLNVPGAFAQMVDTHATPATKNLYHHLITSTQKGILFGHQDDIAYGVGWKYIPGKSDIKAVTGDYPALYGFELGGIELDSTHNLDGVPFTKIRGYIRQVYERGGIITLSWHLRNPVTGGSAWDSTGDVVRDIIPGGAFNAKYAGYLDRVATFIRSLKGDHGEPIPVILRIFHELNGNWFWWGRKNCTPPEMKSLFRFTVHYLRDKKHLHNILYAYNTDRFADTAAYLERFPGRRWTDIIGFDIYQAYAVARNEDFIKDLDKSLTLLEKIAKEKNRIPALTEFGYNGIPDSTWWTDVLLKGLNHHHIAYALAWRNSGKNKKGGYEYYVPFPGQVSARDFVKFYNSGKIIFQKAATREHFYTK